MVRARSRQGEGDAGAALAPEDALKDAGMLRPPPCPGDPSAPQSCPPSPAASPLVRLSGRGERL